MTKTSKIALFIAGIVTLGTPAALLAETEMAGPTKAAASREAITDQEIKLMQQDIQDQRRQLVAANLPLTTEESAKFWPVYDKYIAEVSKVLGFLTGRQEHACMCNIGVRKAVPQGREVVPSNGLV